MAPPGQFIPPPKGDIAQLARLGPVLSPHGRRIIGALAALVVASACVLALGQGLRAVIDTRFGSGAPAAVDDGSPWCLRWRHCSGSS